MLMRCEPEPVVKPCGGAGVGRESASTTAACHPGGINGVKLSGN